MVLSNQEKNVLETLRNISGEKIDRVDNVLKSLLYYSLMCYSEGESVLIPHFGRFKITFLGDEITKGGREAKLDTLYFPSNEIKLNIGIMEDIKKHGGEITEVPLIKELMKEIQLQLKYVINEGELESTE
jgi:hypothetical protein